MSTCYQFICDTIHAVSLHKQTCCILTGRHRGAVLFLTIHLHHLACLSIGTSYVITWVATLTQGTAGGRIQHKPIVTAKTASQVQTPQVLAQCFTVCWPNGPVVKPHNLQKHSSQSVNAQNFFFTWIYKCRC
jgi:hypothetical protein